MDVSGSHSRRGPKKRRPVQLVRQGFAREQRSFGRKARGTHVDSFLRPPSLELGSSLSSALSTLNGREQRRSLSSCPLPLP